MIKKRIFDLILVIPGIVMLTPLLVTIAVAIKMDSSGPVFFRQTRVGLRGKHFKVLKFRTMVVDAEARGLRVTAGQDPRITRYGAFLRKYKLDELPQLFNVLKGEMSLVGPRPEVPEYVEFYPAEVRRIVLSTLPGITDLASIEFSEESNILGKAKDPHREYVDRILPTKLAYCQQYVLSRSLFMDLKIILRTLGKISSHT